MIGMVLYDFALGLYFGFLRVVAPLHTKARKMVRGRADTLPTLRKLRQPDKDYIWIHASSLGEFEQGRPLIELLKEKHPSLHICLTFFSPSGYEVRKDYPLADIVTYLPFDTSSDLPRFLDLLRPKIAIFVKYEFWLHTLDALHRREIPTYLISAIFRPTQIFFKKYGNTFRQRLSYYDHIFVQNAESANLLAGIGITSVSVGGDTRMDRVLHIARSSHNIPFFERIKERAKRESVRIVVVGSSWEEDESIYLPLFESIPQLFTIIVPHEITERHISSIRSLSSREVLLYTEYEDKDLTNLTSTTLVVDTVGMLSSLYAYADFAYIGGGFGKGIHNTAEAAVYGIPVIFGPKYEKFREAKALIEVGGGYTVKDSSGLESILVQWLSEDEALQRAGKAAGDYISSESGATEKIYQKLLPLLP